MNMAPLAYSAAVEQAARGTPVPVEAMDKPVWHAHVVMSPELRVQMNRTQRAAQASAERAAAAAEKGRARSRSLMSGPSTSAGTGATFSGSEGDAMDTSSDESSSSDDEPIALIAETLKTSASPRAKKPRTNDDDGPATSTAPEPRERFTPAEHSDRDVVAASLHNPLVLTYDPNAAARDAPANRARIKASQRRLGELGAFDSPLARYAPVFLNMVFDPSQPAIADEFLWDALGESVKSIGRFAQGIVADLNVPDFAAGHVEAKMLRDVRRHCESWTAGLERMLRANGRSGRGDGDSSGGGDGDSSGGGGVSEDDGGPLGTVGRLGEVGVTVRFRAVVPARGAAGGATVVGDEVTMDALSPLADPEEYAIRLVSDEAAAIFGSPDGEGEGPSGDDEATAAAAIALALRVAVDERVNGAPEPEPDANLPGFSSESMRAAAERIRAKIMAKGD